MSERDEKAYTYDEAVELTGHGRYQHLLLVACSITSNAVALEMFGISIIVAAAHCDLKLGVTETGLLASAPFAGVIFAFPWGYFADTRGRRRALLLSTSIGFVIAAISSFSPNWQIMVFLKISASCFSATSYTLTMTLLGESTGSRHRSQYLFIMNSINVLAECISFSLAHFLLPLKFRIYIPGLGIYYSSWRLYTLVLTLPLGFGGIMIAYLYESPKFLANKRRDKEALEVLRGIYARNGGKKDEFPVVHLQAESGSNETEKNTTFWNSVVKQTVPIFKPPLLKRTLQLFFLMALCCSTNNAFVMWYPTIVNVFMKSMNSAKGGWWNTDRTFCERVFIDNNSSMTHGISKDENYVCNAAISTETIICGVLYGLFFSSATLLSSCFAAHRRRVLIAWLAISGVSGVLVDLRLPATSLPFFVLFQTPVIALPSLVAYCVDLYSTAYRGMMTSLGLMVARLASLAGINLVGAVITKNCSWTFYTWSLFVFSGIALSLFLPSDKAMNSKLNEASNINVGSKTNQRSPSRSLQMNSNASIREGKKEQNT